MVKALQSNQLRLFIFKSFKFVNKPINEVQAIRTQEFLHINIMSMYSVIIIIIQNECPQESNKIGKQRQKCKRSKSLNVGYHQSILSSGADLGGGCMGCAPPPLPHDMTCGFLIQVVFCKTKKETRMHPPPKKILDPPPQLFIAM